MNDEDHQRKSEEIDSPTSLEEKQKEFYQISDWTGTLRLFSLYPQLFLFFMIPIIYNISGYVPLQVINIALAYLIGSLLAKMVLPLLRRLSPSIIKGHLILVEILITACFIVFSFSIYLFPNYSFQLTLWGVLGVLAAWHDRLEKLFLTRVLRFKPQTVRNLTESPELMTQSLFYFLILFFLMVIMPFLIGSFLSFFSHTKDNFSAFIPMAFGNLILTFIIIYHLAMMNLNSKYQEKKFYPAGKHISFLSSRALKHRPHLMKEKIKDLNWVFFLFNIASLAPLVSFNFFFMYAQPHVPPLILLLNLVILSSLSLMFKTLTFFYLSTFFQYLNPRRMARASMMVFTLALMVYIYFLMNEYYRFYLIAPLIITLRLCNDIVQGSFFYQANQKSLRVTSDTLVSTFPQFSVPTLLFSLVLCGLYPFIRDSGLYVLSIGIILTAIFLSIGALNKAHSFL